MRAVCGACELPDTALGPDLGAKRLGWSGGVSSELGTAGSGRNSDRLWEEGSGSGERVR